MFKVVNIADVDSALLFEDRGIVIGDNEGPWLVMNEDTIYGRYISKAEADAYAVDLTDNFDKDTTECGMCCMPAKVFETERVWYFFKKRYAHCQECDENFVIYSF